MAVHLLGIRHHGPGSARNVKEQLQQLRPDIILLEGPPEAEPILQWAAHADMKPPVAILAYVPDDLQKALFYPFAEFSPEWQAIQYAIANKIPLRFMDLPLTHKLAMEETPAPVKEQEKEAESDEPLVPAHADPFLYLAEIAGYNDGEAWWENTFEHRRDNTDIFEAVNMAVSALREHMPEEESHTEKCREAWMRKTIRQAEKELFNDIAVICGAWHVPALQNMPPQKEDNELLKVLPKVKTECTWIPWTYGRLSFASGYGAGINSPGWYEHIWHTQQDISTLWLTKVARLFRKSGMDVSSAHVIETVRLAETLASLRGFRHPGLEELNEAANSVMCMGDEILMSMIRTELIVSPKIGSVPLDAPKTPLQGDIEKQQKQLRLPITEFEKEIVLDLREERDLAKSIFLHRLLLLDIKWGNKRGVSGKGTFKEAWILHWEPALAIAIIDKGVWGNHVEQAANNYLAAQAAGETALQKIAALLNTALLADLPGATESLVNRVNSLAAASADVMQLMQALPALVNALRYGNVRKTDSDVLGRVVNSMITRICISLPAACQAVDEDAAQQLSDLFFELNEAITLLQQDEQLKEWHKTLLLISGNPNTSPLVAGYATRLIHDFKLLEEEALQNKFAQALSSASGYPYAAAWLEGFLRGSGTLLLIDEALWALVNNWVNGLDEANFTDVLPLMRRTFSQFSHPERRKLGEKAKGSDGTKNKTAAGNSAVNHDEGMKAIPVILHLLGIE